MPISKLSLEKLEITNFKRFYGFHVLDLRTDPDHGKNIVLIGGENGAGKTTIHEAINYTLYEDDDLPGISTKPTYIRAVYDRLNRQAILERKQDYYVAIEMLADDFGTLRHFRIERHWKPNFSKKTIEETKLCIFENGRKIDFIEDNPQAYQEFLRNLLPPRIAPFFFFDGERIQEFADDDNREGRMVEAIEDILHISVYKKLRVDLKNFVIDHIEKHEIKPISTDDFFDLQEDKEKIEICCENKRSELDDIERELDELRRKCKQLDDQIKKIASPYSSQRNELLIERDDLNRELESSKNDLDKGFIPLTILLAGNLRRELYSTLESEKTRLSTPEQVKSLNLKLNDVKFKTFESDSIPQGFILSSMLRSYYTSRFEDVVNDVFEFNHSDSPALLHDIGENARHAILKRLKDVSSFSQLLKDSIDKRERLNNELRDIETKIQSTTNDPYVVDIINNNNELNKKLGEYEQKKKVIITEIQQFEEDIAGRARQIQDRIEKRATTTEAKRTIKLAITARKVLDEFIHLLAPEKLKMLQYYMDAMYNKLKKDEDPARYIEIDPDTWEVILKDENKQKLEKRVFSAGMKEIYALSLLWSLSKASGKALPIVIDTPVGRLDITNRRTLFEKYLPDAGHQVIVLSTDAEVDVDWARKLSKYVAKQYRLDYDSSTKSTVISLGYFF